MKTTGLSQLLLHLGEGRRSDFRDHQHRGHHHRYDEQGDYGQFDIDDQHDGDDHDDEHGGADDLGHALLIEGSDDFGIVGHPAQELADRRSVEKTHRQRLQVGKEICLQLVERFRSQAGEGAIREKTQHQVDQCSYRAPHNPLQQRIGAAAFVDDIHRLTGDEGQRDQGHQG